jgi:hypothetical protein
MALFRYTLTVENRGSQISQVYSMELRPQEAPQKPNPLFLIRLDGVHLIGAIRSNSRIYITFRFDDPPFPQHFPQAADLATFQATL